MPQHLQGFIVNHHHHDHHHHLLLLLLPLLIVVVIIVIVLIIIIITKNIFVRTQFSCLLFFFCPLQYSMTALTSHGCRVMEGDITFDWTGGGMLLEQPLLWLRV